jgi:hypothetical protein
MMSDAMKCKIGFGRTARTLLYEDELGILCFTFDISPAAGESKGTWNLHLSGHPLVKCGNKYEPTPAINSERAETALERVTEYATSCGYLVLLDECSLPES